MRSTNPSIVLTGGPGAGKSAVGAALIAWQPGRFILVPEAATQVYRLRSTRWDRLDDAGRREVQRHIYQLQLEQEQRLRSQHPDGALLLDRGTVDGAAYWPDGPEEYWRAMGTTLAAEYARYDLVIWMQSAAAIGLYDGHTSNPCRCEDAASAVERGEVVARLWSGHPRFHRVPAFPTLQEKVLAVKAIAE